jgi:hypothetical protein
LRTGGGMRIALLSLLCFCTALRADFNAVRWRWLRVLPAGEPGHACTVILDRAVYQGAQVGLADLRLAANGHEVPYILETLTGSAQQTELQPEILNRSVVPGAGLELTLDLGRAARHNRLRITTSQQNFRIKVRIETSSDGRHWALARNDGYVFDFTQSGRSISVLTVGYPLSTRRYVRVTFFGWMRTDDVTGAWLTDYQERPAVWETIATAEPAREEKDKTSVLTLDLGAARLPSSRLRLQTGDQPFHRACELEASDDRTTWRYVAQGVLYRFPGEEPSALEFPEQHTRYLRLRIFNGDDAPVPVRRVLLDAVEHRVKFLCGTAGGYTLYYGNPKAAAPAYDLAAILARGAPAPELPITAGPEQKNPVYRPEPPPEKPWSERHPGVLYGTLAAAVLVMGYITARFLMKVQKQR